MRSFDDCVSGRFAAYGEPMPAPESAVPESSLVRRFLDSAGRAEVEDAYRTVRELRTGSEDQAVVRLIDERRGEASDMIASVLANATAGVIGLGLGKQVHPLAGVVPGAAMMIAGFVAKQPYPVRQGLLTSGLAMVGASLLQKGNK